VAIHREAAAVQLLDCEIVPFDVLIVATGAKARRLAIPGIDRERVYERRAIRHARVLYDVLSPGRHLAMVGGGGSALKSRPQPAPRAST
jgi:3-phenylpropionate/trans-cinnamate dioxygenase ferredoxin reductase component